MGQLVTPEGMKITTDSVSSLTPGDVEQLIRQSARSLVEVAGSCTSTPCLTVKLQDTYSSACSATALRIGEEYAQYKATIYLNGKPGTTFSSHPEAQSAHEYGHAYTLRARYIESGGSWVPYLSARGLIGDARVDRSGYAWTSAEIAADDYRLLFGSDKAISQLPRHMNRYIPDPRDVAGLRDWIKAWGG